MLKTCFFCRQKILFNSLTQQIINILPRQFLQHRAVIINQFQSQTALAFLQHSLLHHRQLFCSYTFRSNQSNTIKPAGQILRCNWQHMAAGR